ncbi:acetyltransferase, GNAT family [Burkholderiales bacterium GJ-E10]|nr:acetyltransferase, GNAT family [Burkholderiales bacterium GJ-E10]
MEEAGAADAEAIVSLIGDLLEEIMKAVGAKVFSFDAVQSAPQLRRWLDLGRYAAIVAREPGGRIVGVVTLSESCALYAGGFFGIIPEFYVVPERRSLGVGAKLAAAASAYARSRGWQRLEVTTPPLPQFQRTLAFYERQGFSVTGGRKCKQETHR